MRSAGELTDYYYGELYDSLQALEAERLRVRKNVLIFFALLGSIALAVDGWIYSELQSVHEGMAWSAFGTVALGGIGYRLMTSGYRSSFKEKIIRPMIRAIEEGLRYVPDGVLPQSLFQFSHLFEQRIDRYSGNDLVEGAIDGIPLQFSDVHAEQRTRDSKGREHWQTVFKGHFIVADFNKHFRGRTLVLPDLAEKLFGSFIGNMLQSNNFAKDQLVKMDDPAFERAFVVYGTDQIEARYILTHTMMQRLMELKKRTGQEIFASFNGGKIMIAIAYNRDLFEPSVFSSLLSVRQAMEYINTLRSAVGIVEELKLNEKLWSKR